jgi:glycosyltransferase involved in cell wall biosynthesis
MIKVAHVATIDLSLRFLLLNQLQSLSDSGYAITGVSAAGPHVIALEERGIRHIPVHLTRSMTPVADLLALWRLYRIMRREQFTIVHCHTPKAELLGQLAARLAGVPIVIDTFRGIYDRKGGNSLQRWLLVRLSRIATSCADLVLCQSREAMASLLREGVCESDRLAHLGNGIDVRRFDRRRVDPGDLESARKALGIDSARPVIGFVGRLVREKGILDLFAAMCLVRARFPQAQLLVIGPADTDKPDSVTPEQARDYGIDGNCVFAGLRTDMPVLYSLMDVFVLPSHREGFPRAPMEALAMEVPCIATDIPGCREVIDHGHNGLLVPVGSPIALAGAIGSLLDDPARARKMARAGRARALESFDEQKVFATVKSMYARLLSEKRITSSPVSIDRKDPLLRPN